MPLRRIIDALAGVHADDWFGAYSCGCTSDRSEDNKLDRVGLQRDPRAIPGIRADQRVARCARVRRITMTRLAAGVGLSFAAGLALFAGGALAASGPSLTGAITQDGGVTGISAHGSFTAATGELTAARFFHASVTCLEVTGNDGIATAVIDSSRDPGTFPVGETIVAEGFDTDATVPKSTTPGLATDLWRISFASNGGIFPDFAHPGCFLPFFAPVPIDRGDIRVSTGS
jgi:hypothetical protein